MKKLRINIFLMAIAGVLFISCGDEKNQQDAQTLEVDEMEQVTPNEGEDAIPDDPVDFDNAGLQTVFDEYIDLKDALVASDQEEAMDAASRLELTLSNIEANDSLTQAVQDIQNSGGLEEQRETFFIVSKEMEKLVDGSIQSGFVYKQHCPMAFDGQGAYWLSTSQIIQNPYYGDKMLKCGSVEKTYSEDGTLEAED